MNSVLARLILRYGVGGIAGAALGVRLADDPDVVALLSGAVSVVVPVAGVVLTELWYIAARRLGWKT